jgi:hypothetical protein
MSSDLSRTALLAAFAAVAGIVAGRRDLPGQSAPVKEAPNLKPTREAARPDSIETEQGSNGATPGRSDACGKK